MHRVWGRDFFLIVTFKNHCTKLTWTAVETGVSPCQWLCWSSLAHIPSSPLNRLETHNKWQLSNFVKLLCIPKTWGYVSELIIITTPLLLSVFFCVFSFSDDCPDLFATVSDGQSFIKVQPFPAILNLLSQPIPYFMALAGSVSLFAILPALKHPLT